MSDIVQAAVDRIGAPSNLEDIRIRFAQALESEKSKGAQVKDIAQEIGIGLLTMHGWRANTYPGDMDEIGKKIEKWLVTRAARERTRATVRSGPTFMKTRTAQEILDILEYAQGEPDMVVVSGGAGIGKTTTVLNYQAVGSRVFVMTARPLINTIGAMMQMMATAVRIQRSGSNYETGVRIQEALSGTRGLVIVDEAQHLPPVLRDEWRSVVYDAARVGVALVGNEKLHEQFSRERATGQFAQSISRFGQRINREAPYNADVDLLLQGWGVQGDAARKVCIGIAKKPGALRQMTKTLKIAFALSDARGDEEPAAEDIERAWRELGGKAE